LTVAVTPIPEGLTLVPRETNCVVPLTRPTVTVEVVPDPWTTDPLDGLRLTLKSKLVDVLNEPTWLMTVFQFWKVESLRYSDSIQNVDAAVGVGSVAAPK
jgi:hypothetical protein